MGPGVQIVWFKRDLRLDDHRPLADAARAGPVLALYVYEPELLQQAESDTSHWVFIEQSLRELDAGLRRLGARLTCRVGAMPAVLTDLHEALRGETGGGFCAGGAAGGIAALRSHEETGNGLTYARDRRVAAWCRERGVPWHETPQHGVVRGLRSRSGWAGRWLRRMNEPRTPPPARLLGVSSVAPGFDHGRVRTPAELGLPPTTKTVDVQPGGEGEGLRTLRTFLDVRGEHYRADMASPVTGFAGCSRLSAHLAYGTVSLRSVHVALRERQAELRAMPAAERGTHWLKSLTSFQGRLRWHCHFMQKLEDEPAIEFENFNRAYDGLRTEDPAHWSEAERARFDAWRLGRTGYPFVDACMRSLHGGGWLNFRMRSMLVSFASYHLWLHWRPTAVEMARHFLDFEPGIHFSQFQMQSGTTGINTVRIYSPVKQSMERDPSGLFIRRWVPELAGVPAAQIHEPWKHGLSPPPPGAGGGGGRAKAAAEAERGLFAALEGSRRDARTPLGYPGPIVDHAAAYREAQQRVFARRGTAAARGEARRVYEKHGSRRTPTDPPYRGGPEQRGLA